MIKKQLSSSLVFSHRRTLPSAETSALLVQSAGLAAGVAARGPAALLLPGTLAVLVAELGAHVGGLGRQATPRLH